MPKDLVDESSSAATVYRVLAARIVYGDPTDILHSVAVVDAESDTGSAVVAVNVGRALARLGRRVILIDGGSRDGLAPLFGVEPAPGVRDIMNREIQPRSAMRMIGERLALVPAGYEGGELIDPERAKAVLNELMAYADVIVVATPPVQAGPAALSWARAVDGTVLVARRDHARREDVAAAAETLVHVGGSLIGTILAERPAPLSVAVRARPLGLVPGGRRRADTDGQADADGQADRVPAAGRAGPGLDPAVVGVPSGTEPDGRRHRPRPSARRSSGQAHRSRRSRSPRRRSARWRRSRRSSRRPSRRSSSPSRSTPSSRSSRTHRPPPAPKRSSATTSRSTTSRARPASRSTTSRSGPNTTS